MIVCRLFARLFILVIIRLTRRVMVFGGGHMDWLDYRDKLGIGFNDSNKVNYFMIKIFNVLESFSEKSYSQISDGEYFTFCNMTGTSMRQGSLCGDGYRIIVNVLKQHSKNLVDFIAYYIAFINCQKDSEYKKLNKENFKNILCNMLAESHIPYDLLEDNGNYFVFPKGAEELDDALVSDVLLWLKNYPQTQKAWIKALKDYSESSDATASETADNFRKALERFLQEFFQSNKSLENMKSDYGSYLSQKGVPAELRNNLETLLAAYANYINNYAKHHDKASKDVLEYLMYQTGNIMRLIITLEK